MARRGAATPKRGLGCRRRHNADPKVAAPARCPVPRPRAELAPAAAGPAHAILGGLDEVHPKAPFRGRRRGRRFACGAGARRGPSKGAFPQAASRRSATRGSGATIWWCSAAGRLAGTATASSLPGSALSRLPHRWQMMRARGHHFVRPDFEHGPPCLAGCRPWTTMQPSGLGSGRPPPLSLARALCEVAAGWRRQGLFR